MPKILPKSLSGEIPIFFADTPARLHSSWQAKTALEMNLTVPAQEKDALVARARAELSQRKTIRLTVNKVRNVFKVGKITINGEQVYPWPVVKD